MTDRNGVVGFGKYVKLFGKTAVEAQLTVVFQFQWTSNAHMEKKWVELVRQLGTASVGEMARERNLAQHLRPRAPQTWMVLCTSVDQRLRTTVESSATQPTPMDINAVVLKCACSGRSGREKSNMPNAQRQVWHKWQGRPSLEGMQAA